MGIPTDQFRTVLRPTIVEWPKRDPDLKILWDRPDFKALWTRPNLPSPDAGT